MDYTEIRKRARQKPRALNETEWIALLAALDPDPNQAAEKYETAQLGLIRIFRLRGFWSNAEDLADQTIDRSARRLVEKAGTTEPVRNIQAYMQAVAKKIAGEEHRRPRQLPIEKAPEPADDPRAREDEAPELQERRLECLRELIQSLPESERNLIVEYYRYARSVKITRRALLAEDSRRSSGALRIKVYRIRRLLGKQLEQRLARGCEMYPGNSGKDTGRES